MSPSDMIGGGSSAYLPWCPHKRLSGSFCALSWTTLHARNQEASRSIKCWKVCSKAEHQAI